MREPKMVAMFTAGICEQKGLFDGAKDALLAQIGQAIYGPERDVERVFGDVRRARDVRSRNLGATFASSTRTTPSP